MDMITKERLHSANRSATKAIVNLVRNLAGEREKQARFRHEETPPLSLPSTAQGAIDRAARDLAAMDNLAERIWRTALDTQKATSEEAEYFNKARAARAVMLAHMVRTVRVEERGRPIKYRLLDGTEAEVEDATLTLSDWLLNVDGALALATV